MERLVYGVFKAIILSMLFVVIWQLGFYLYDLAILDQRMSNLMVSMEKTVSENNYMPSEEAQLYYSIINQIAEDFSGGVRTVDGTTYGQYKNAATTGHDGFISDWSWNYNGLGNYRVFNPTTSDWTNADGGTSYDMSIPNSYGSVACIHVAFDLRAPWIGFGHANETVRTNGTGATAAEWHVEKVDVDLAYTSYVPCLKYRKITD